jgi:redox-sensing transcriptional repressor
MADMAYNSAAQVRRDLMVVGCMGSPAHGYSVQELIARIDALFEKKGAQKVALVGLGKLGRAILAYFGLRPSRLRVTVAFDVDAEKVNREVDGCACYPVKDMPEIIARERIAVGIVAVPAQAAQQVVDLMVIAGVKGFLNFAPTLLKVPKFAFVDNVDITMKLEKVAFFAEPTIEKLPC